MPKEKTFLITDAVRPRFIVHKVEALNTFFLYERDVLKKGGNHSEVQRPWISGTLQNSHKSGFEECCNDVLLCKKNLGELQCISSTAIIMSKHRYVLQSAMIRSEYLWHCTSSVFM